MTSSETAPDEPSRPLHKNPFFWGFIIGAVVLMGIKPLQELFLSAPPPIAKVSAWSLTDHNGKPFGTEQLKGKVFVANFFFTRCPSICLELTRTMKRVQESFSKLDGVELVSFTVDPDHDSPEALREYMKKTGADLPNWTFVTGPKEQLGPLYVDQFKVPLGERTPINGAAATQDTLYDISHTGKLLLFDQNGDLRAFFGIDPPSLGAMGNATRLLLRKGPDA